MNLQKSLLIAHLRHLRNVRVIMVLDFMGTLYMLRPIRAEQRMKPRAEASSVF